MPAAPANPAPGEVIWMLQTELKRVGCYDGPISGDWTQLSRRALEAFNRNAGTKFDTKSATLDSLGAVRDLQKRVCPLECGRGLRPNGDECVKITCDPGFVMGDSGACERSKDRAVGFATATGQARRSARTAHAGCACPVGRCTGPRDVRLPATSRVRPVRLPAREKGLFGQDVGVQRRNTAKRGLQLNAVDRRDDIFRVNFDPAARRRYTCRW